MSAYQKQRTRHDTMLRFVKTLNAFIMTLIFGYFWQTYLAMTVYSPYFRKGNWLVIFLFFVLYVAFGRTYDAFLISYQRIPEIVYSQMLALVEADVIMFVVDWLLKKYFPFIPIFLAMLAVQLLASVVWSYAASRWYFRYFPPKKSFVVWDMRTGMTDLVHSYGLNKKFHIQGNCSADECVENLSVLDGKEVVFLSGVHSHDRNVIIKYCVEHRIRVFVIPRVGDVMMSGAKRMHMFHLPMLRLDRYNPNPEFLFFKRLFDIILSAIALVILSPVILVTAIAIHRTDGGPVFYRQCRLTKDGREFDVLKFRSMRIDAEKDGVARLSTGENDPRITPVGRKIRALRIDELPQLINILKGDMSIVGPRPERPEIAAEYEKELPEFRLRLQAKCGLTGYAQVYGKYNTTPYDKLLMDLMYMAHPSIMQDFAICLATVKILFMPESTEGIAEGQTTAAVNNKKEKEDKVERQES